MALCPFAEWRGPVSNEGGPIGTLRLGVFHVMEGTLDGTDSWFHDPTAQVSSHFGVGKDGRIFQWVDTFMTAWAQGPTNGVAISIENEGNSGDFLTGPQYEADKRLIQWIGQTSPIPARRTSNANGAGWIGHGEVGGNPPHPQCPGTPMLLGLDSIITELNAPPAPPPIPGDGMFAALASSKQDNFDATVRYLWGMYRSDTLTGGAFQYLWAGYTGPWAGSFDQVLACIIDTATTQGHLRPQWAGAA